MNTIDEMLAAFDANPELRQRWDRGLVAGLLRELGASSRAAHGNSAGWKLVPIEPTREMLIALKNAGQGGRERWAALLAATPAAPPADGPTVDLRAIAELAGISMDCWDMGAASLAHSEGVHGVTREHLERFAAAYGYACWNAALEANPPHMQGLVRRALDSLFQAPATAQGEQP